MTFPTNAKIEEQILFSLKDQKVHDIKEVREIISKKFNLTDEELQKTSPGKNRLVFNTRIISSLSRLRKKGFIVNEKLGVFKITKEGLKEVKQK